MELATQGKDVLKEAQATKAERLLNLLPRLTTAKILPLYYFSVAAWKKNKNAVLTELDKVNWFNQPLIVRSSAKDEDSKNASMAGLYESVIDVKGKHEFISAVEKIISSYQNLNNLNPDNQILLQPLLQDVIVSGVAFSRDPNTGGPYHIINYNDSSSDTAAVTSGLTNQKCTIQHHQAISKNALINKVTTLIKELKILLASDDLDIEFALNNNNDLYLFQVRPLICKNKINISASSHKIAIERIANRIALGLKPHPYLLGTRTVYGVMPDWNPAEIIGVRPKPLALSLYRELVTDAVWAYQRDNYGYANLRSFPLLVDFEGLPYIDVRVSFNSFLPKNLPENLAERLVNYYLERLIENPALHDKVEFDIVFSCYTLDLKTRLNILHEYNFDEADIQTIYHSLIQLTNQIIHNQKGLWKKDLEKINKLSIRQSKIFKSDLDPISKMYWILEDCKRYGTLPFAGLARAGFIAVQILKSCVTKNIINDTEYSHFLTSINSVSSMMKNDFNTLCKESFLEKYGHLRPGTYDILSLRYDEAPDLYFDWDTDQEITKSNNLFSLTIQQLRTIQEQIDQDGLQISVLELLEFIKFAIEAREYSKFVFSRSVSEFLKLSALFAAQFNISREDCAFMDVATFISLYSSTVDPLEALQKSIAAGKKRFQTTASFSLPPLITHSDDVWSFDLPLTVPNFITQQKATGVVLFPDSHKDALLNSILLIPSADPGYDWIFSHKIAGFITKYGGVNSHMAIRAGELGIPAIIGAGEIKFNVWSQAKKLHLDCMNKQVLIL